MRILARENSREWGENLLLVVELRKKILIFRDVLDLPPSSGDQPIEELLMRTVEDLHRLYPCKHAAPPVPPPMPITKRSKVPVQPLSPSCNDSPTKFQQCHGTPSNVLNDLHQESPNLPLNMPRPPPPPVLPMFPLRSSPAPMTMPNAPCTKGGQPTASSPPLPLTSLPQPNIPIIPPPPPPPQPPTKLPPNAPPAVTIPPTKLPPDRSLPPPPPRPTMPSQNVSVPVPPPSMVPPNRSTPPKMLLPLPPPPPLPSQNVRAPPPPPPVLTPNRSAPPPPMPSQNASAPPPPPMLPPNTPAAAAPSPPNTAARLMPPPPPIFTPNASAVPAPPPPMLPAKGSVPAPPPPMAMVNGSAPPPPPPMAISNGSAPPPPPPMAISNGSAPPPPPPGAAKALRPKKAHTKLKRSTHMGNLYRVLKGKVEGSSLNCKSSNGKKTQVGGAKGSKQSMADALAEMTKRSAYFQQIEEDIQKHAKTIMEIKASINKFQTKDMAELLKFHQSVESHLEELTDETQVLARFEDFPTKKLETLRTAAALYSKLQGMATTLENWKVETPLGQLLDKVECYFTKLKVEVDALERSKDEDAKRFQSHKIDFDFNILVRIKEAMVDLSSSCMELALKERREAKAATNEEPGSKADRQLKACAKMLWKAFQLAYRVYTFAGGQDDRADKLSRELAQEIETDPHE